MPKPGSKKKPRKVLLGVGLDSDERKRITTGSNFLLVGGSKETHEEMTEKAVKLNEHLKKAGKTLDTVSSHQLDDIAHEVGLRRPDSQRN
jgi:hypothetical protein